MPLMSKSIQIPFAKFHGLGNDFIVARGRGLPSSLAALARAITDRHTGVGADGFIVALPSRVRRHEARVRFFNADGSEPEISGNGIRCAAAYLLARRRTRRRLLIETAAGVKSLNLVKFENDTWTFEVGMGAPILDPAKIPFNVGATSAPVVGFELRTQRGVLPITVTSMGNPHCTVFVADFDSIHWPSLGREIETNPLFPNHTNVEFVRVDSKRQIEVRFWERGVGETMSSGTGSCGAVVACILNGFTARKVRVRTLAGNLEVEWPAQAEVKLTGPAEHIASGVFDYHH
jgi:diaminopimelate epimerase